MIDSVTQDDRGATREGTMDLADGHHAAGDLLLTGASGFLGSHFAVRWLRTHPDSRIACLVRAGGRDEAATRLRACLSRAALDAGDMEGIDVLLTRAQAICGGFDDDAWTDDVAAWRAGRGNRRFGVVHCAANLSFRAADRDSVRHANVEGTRRMLEAAERLGACEFNYVSTAYVAGDRSGDIQEAAAADAPGFSNAYEESKWDAEALVRARCRATGMRFRVFRPSIIIAHSVTHRLSALSGFYNVVEAMRALGRLPGMGNRIVRLPVPDGATLDLVPVDVVVAEMIGLLDAGSATCGKEFHLTSDNPLCLVEILAGLSPAIGLSVAQGSDADGPLDAVSALAMRRLRHYAPYLGQIRRFDRGNVRAAGIQRQEVIDMPRLVPYVTAFLAGDC